MTFGSGGGDTALVVGIMAEIAGLAVISAVSIVGYEAYRRWRVRRRQRRHDTGVEKDPAAEGT